MSLLDKLLAIIRQVQAERGIKSPISDDEFFAIVMNEDEFTAFKDEMRWKYRPLPSARTYTMCGCVITGSDDVEKGKVQIPDTRVLG